MAGGITIIEWAERGEALLPDKRISVTLERIKENGNLVVGQRLIRIMGPQGLGLSDLKCLKCKSS